MWFQLEKLPRWLRDIAPLMLWMVLIFGLSSHARLIRIAHPVESEIFYKTAHVIFYVILLWLWWRVVSPLRQATGSILALAFLLTVMYGISDEFHQWFVPGRHSRVTDVLFDGSGALMMLLLLRSVGWLRNFPENLPSFRVHRPSLS